MILGSYNLWICYWTIFVPCRAGIAQNFMVLCRALGHVKMSCFMQPTNSTAQVPALDVNINY
jgi:hypothetical protein